MSTSIEFSPLATADPDMEMQAQPLHRQQQEQLDDEDLEPITTAPRRPFPRKPTLSDRVEKLTDSAIKGLGPILITVAFVLLSVCIFCFFTVITPYHYTWNEGQGLFGNLGYILTMIWSSYLVWGIMANYYYAVRTPAGSVLDGVKNSSVSPFSPQRVSLRTRNVQVYDDLILPLNEYLE